MENKEHPIENEEINNLAQFQVGRANSVAKEQGDQDDTNYTPEENEFADGKGTQLNEELGEETTEQETQNEDDKEQE